MIDMLAIRSISVLTALAAGCVGAIAATMPDASSAPKISYVDYVAPTDFSDDRRLAGFADHVFVGRVTGAGQTVDRDPLPETSFPVLVVDTLKGTAAGGVTVVQQGGQKPGHDDEHVVLEGDTPLQAGQTYLFATRSDPEGRRFLVARYGDLRVRDAAHLQQLRARFGTAVRTQIPLS